jgi:polysaccharide deacetylase 2 family uncharacterized protein YibQ
MAIAAHQEPIGSRTAPLGRRRPANSAWSQPVVVAFCALLASLACLPQVVAGGPRIGLIIDDMGNQLWRGQDALALPGAITYSFLPHTAHGPGLARKAHLLGKEVMLHLPMESVAGERLGPGALTASMSERQLRAELWAAIASIPHAVGLNNHMGSLLTSDPQAMGWLMASINDADLYFVDSRTTSETVAQRTAEETGVPSTRRDVFLDNEREPDAIRRQLRRLVGLALARGSAVGIGHPYPETIRVLAQELPRIQAKGVRLVPISQLTQTDRRKNLWQASSCHSPRVAKRSKPSP